MNFNHAQAASPRIVLAGQKIEGASEKTRKDGLEWDGVEIEGIKESKRAEAWNRMYASRLLSATSCQPTLGNSNQQGAFTFSLPGYMPPNLQVEIMASIGDPSTFNLDPDFAPPFTGKVSVRIGKVQSGLRPPLVEQPQGGVLTEIFVPQ